eukprot:6977483-Prorocentrum_lima.AAC.1
MSTVESARSAVAPSETGVGSGAGSCSPCSILFSGSSCANWKHTSVPWNQPTFLYHFRLLGR